MYIDVAILVECFVFTVSVKLIKQHSRKREMFGTKTMKLCCVCCRKKNICTPCW